MSDGRELRERLEVEVRLNPNLHKYVMWSTDALALVEQLERDLSEAREWLLRIDRAEMESHDWVKMRMEMRLYTDAAREGETGPEAYVRAQREAGKPFPPPGEVGE